MSFSRELKDFSEGFKSGSQLGTELARAKEANARAAALQPAPIDDTPIGGGGEITQTPAGTDTTTTTSSTGPASTSDKGQFLQRAYDHYRKAGLGHNQAAAIAGNLQMESGGDPRVFAGVRTGDAGISKYAGQWNHERLAKLEAFAKSRGNPKPTLPDQLDFVLEEGKADSPYADKVWASKMPGFMAAKTPDEAATLFMNGFERPNADPKINRLDKRIGWANSLKDSGPSATAAAAPAPAGGAGVKASGTFETPEEKTQDTASSDESYSPKSGIRDPGDIQLASANIDPFKFLELGQVYGGPQTQPGSEQALPTMFAEQGGIIPEPTQMFADGGMPVIDYTQAPPPVAPAVTPKPATPTATGPTRSQLAFTNANKKPITMPKATPPAPAPAPAAPTQSWIQMAPEGFGGGYGGGTGGGSSQMEWHVDPISGKRRAMPRGAHFVPQKLMTQYPNMVMPGLMRYQEGGIIPDPDEPPVQAFAKGGAVDDQGYFTKRDERFNQLLREETRRAPTQHGGGDNARDRAARRLSALEGRPSSTAYSPGRKRLPPGKGGKIQPKDGGKGDTTKSINKPELADPHTNVVPTPTPEIADPHTNVVPGPTPEIADPHTNVTPTAPPVKPGPLPAPEIIKKVLPGPPDVIPDEPVNVGGAMDPGSTGVLPDPYAPPAPPVEASPDAVAADVAANKLKADAAKQRLLEQKNAANQPALAPGALAATPPDLVQQPPPAPDVPVIPEQVDLRPAPAAPALAAPAAPTGVDHAALLNGAMKALAAGQDPQAIGQLLLNAGITQELWPLELQNKYLGFAKGGMIPEPGERGYNEAVGAGLTATQEPQQEQVQATPKLLSHVGQAVDHGLKFLINHFGLGGEGGAIPSPDDAQTSATGAARFGSGEGAATPDEIDQVDNAVDPERRLDEGHRQMSRLANSVTWYLEHGRKDDAGAAAASLMQYGAKRFGQLGGAAEVAYRSYLSDGDPKNLEKAKQYLESAYKMIPDGADVNVTIDPQTNRLQARRVGPDGKVDNYDISAEEIPGLLQSVQDGSMYWKQIYRLGDPQGTQQKQSQEYETAKTESQRAYDEQKDLRKRGLDLETKTAEEARTAAAEESRSARDKAEAERVRLENEALTRSRPKQPGAGDIDMTKVGPPYQAATAAKAAWTADPSDANKAALDAATSRLLDAVGGDQAWMQGAGFDLPTQYETPAPGPPPADHPDATWHNGEWQVERDGKLFRLVPEPA